MGSFLTSPALFIGGLIAIASPIIIHLLNKRRFKRVDWAAMDFLIEAQKLNRRKVKLEEFILLLMRCLAMGLIGFLLARPFFSSGTGAGLFNDARYERIIVLDDSLSMQAKAGGQTSMEASKVALEKWVTDLVGAGTDDSLTLVLTSDPGKMLYDSTPLNENTETEIVDDIKNLKSSDGGGNLEAALAFVENKVADGDASVNRVVYLLSDLRERDWAGTGETADAGVVATMKRIAETTAGCFVIDVGKEGEENLAIEEIAAIDKALIAGVTTNFEVVVRNRGTKPALDVKVRFAADESLPLDGTIDRIEPGQTGAVPFTFTFAPAIEGEGEPEPVAIKATLAEATGDVLEEDNTRFFPARTVRGIQTLIVDGDPNGSFGRGETFFMSRALAPEGSTSSGVQLKVVDDNDFETLELNDYQVIFIANLYRISEARVASLEEWVRAGGGLIFTLGDQIDEDFYNTVLYKDGEGVFPAKLNVIGGDETEEQWVFFNIEKSNHPVMQYFAEENAKLLEGVKIFRWWECVPNAAALADGRTTVVLSLTGDGKSPAMIDSKVGDGRVMVMATPMDPDWNNWPEEAPSFIISAQEMTRYMARSNAKAGQIAVGQSIAHEIDLTRAKPEVTVTAPGGNPERVPARPPAGAASSATMWNVDFDDTRQRGFYRMALEGSSEAQPERTVLFAANTDPEESALRRVPAANLALDLGDKISLIDAGQPVLDLRPSEAKNEFWKPVLYVLAALLCIELMYGWWLGARR
ncbi:MAG: hypothetical protein ACI8XO_001655 [Verrucomicrobiales bacterium]|jgi:hypothetical protein